MKVKFINARVLINESSKARLEDLQVLVNGNKIEKIAKQIDEVAETVIDVKGNVLMPGFVNAHAHNPMTLLRGVKQDANLQTWLFDYMLPAEEKLSPQDIFVGQLLGMIESIKAGITTIEENYFFYEAILEAVKLCGLRARIGIGKCRKGKGITQNLTDALKLFDKNSNFIKPVVFPHSIYIITEEEMDELVSFSAMHNLPISTHLSETLTEVVNCMTEHKKTPPQYLEHAGFLDRVSTLYHCVHVDKDDMELLKNYNASVVTCPSANLVLGSGVCPVYGFLNKGINVAIGTDGPASNNSIDMFKEMFLTASLQKGTLRDATVLTVDQVLAMATENGAKALGFENVGKIKEGFFADIILVDITGTHHQPHNNIVTNLVYSAKSSDVYFTMVNGKILYQDRLLNLPFSESDVYAQAKSIAAKIAKL